MGPKAPNARKGIKTLPERLLGQLEGLPAEGSESPQCPKGH